MEYDLPVRRRDVKDDPTSKLADELVQTILRLYLGDVRLLVYRVSSFDGDHRVQAHPAYAIPAYAHRTRANRS